jgi:hypothetical protein
MSGHDAAESDEAVTRWRGYESGWSAVRFPDGWVIVQPSTRADAVPDVRLDGLAIITAANPYGERLTDEENERRHERLRIRLAAAGVPVRASVGGFADAPDPETWSGRERGFAVALSREEAAMIAGEFDQEAIYVFEHGARILISVGVAPAVEGFYRSGEPDDGTAAV